MSQFSTVQKCVELLKSPEIWKRLNHILTPQRLIYVLDVVLKRTPELEQCEPNSLFMAIVTCLEHQLDPVLEEVYLVPYFSTSYLIDDVTAMLSTKGLKKIVYASDKVTNVWSQAVYSKDDFELVYGLNKNIIHKPYLNAEKGHLLGFYSVVNFENGQSEFSYLSVDDINDLCMATELYDAWPWSDEYQDLAKKTVVKDVFRNLPRSCGVERSLFNYELLASKDDTKFFTAKIKRNPLNALLESPNLKTVVGLVA